MIGPLVIRMRDKCNGHGPFTMPPVIFIAPPRRVTHGWAMKTLATALMLLVIAGSAAEAASLSKSYSYFSIGGRTLSEIEAELGRRGPQLNGAGRRHPGATRMEFTTKVTYGESRGQCGIAKANVLVDARMILPRWSHRKGSEVDVQLIWDTLSADIKRHEESHVVIAKNFARELEGQLIRIKGFPNCQAAAARVKEITEETLARHDREQLRFDQIEGINFEKRIMRLLKYRLERIGNGKLPG
jgi:predicted secreted Zn-dependent protease